MTTINISEYEKLAAENATLHAKVAALEEVAKELAAHGSCHCVSFDPEEPPCAYCLAVKLTNPGKEMNVPCETELMLVIQERDRLKQRVQELERDRARLDWALSDLFARIERYVGHNSFNHQHIWERVYSRHDIDAAIQAEPPKA